MLVQKRKSSSISISERHQIIQEYLNSDKKKVEIWYKYTGQTEEHGQIIRWMRNLGYLDKSKNDTFVPIMEKQNDSKDKSVDNAQLKKRIKELEKALEYSELKAKAYSTMIEVAEKELNISIKKK